METGVEIRTFEGHTGGFFAVSMTPDCRRAISGSEDNTIKAWNLETGNEIRTFKVHTCGVIAISVTYVSFTAFISVYDPGISTMNLSFF